MKIDKNAKIPTMQYFLIIKFNEYIYYLLLSLTPLLFLPLLLLLLLFLFENK